jgi:hypothetical protein
MALMIAAANYAPLKVRWRGLGKFPKRPVQSARRDIAVP